MHSEELGISSPELISAAVQSISDAGLTDQSVLNCSVQTNLGLILP